MEVTVYNFQNMNEKHTFIVGEKNGPDAHFPI